MLNEQSKEEVKQEKEANKARKEYRHYFETIKFHCSLTNKDYYTSMGEGGVLVIKEADTGIEIPNHSKPSKKAIVIQALSDLGIKVDKNKTLYQLAHLLIKEVDGI